MGFTSEGYIPRTALEIKESLKNRLLQIQSQFLEFNADIQNNILDTACVAILEYENLLNELANSFALNNTNDFYFKQLADSLGLMRKDEYKASVDIVFNGKEGDFIPKNTEVSDNNGKFSFTTQTSAIIGSSGNVTLTCLGDSKEIAEANTINTINTIISESITCNNPSASQAFVSAESSDELKQRAQAKLRATKSGGIDYAMNALSAISGVNQRLINIRVVEKTIKKNEQNYLTNGIEAVIGGGDIYEIANALRIAFFESQKLISTPSNNENERTAKISLDLYGNSIEIQFTRPKQYAFNLLCQILMVDKFYSDNELLTLITTPLQDYCNNLRVGVVPNKTKLSNIVLNEFLKNGFDLNKISKVDFKYSQGSGEWIAFDSELPNIYHDIYINLSGVSVTTEPFAE